MKFVQVTFSMEILIVDDVVKVDEIRLKRRILWQFDNRMFALRLNLLDGETKR